MHLGLVPMWEIVAGSVQPIGLQKPRAPGGVRSVQQNNSVSTQCLLFGKDDSIAFLSSQTSSNLLPLKSSFSAKDLASCSAEG